MTKPATGIGHSQRVIGASCHTATRNTISDATAKAITSVRESSPEGISRRAVRGLRASMAASISLFSAIARLRAPTIATVIQKTWLADGTSPSARIAPV